MDDSKTEANQLFSMSERNYTRPAQIPIRRDRFIYLMDPSSLKEDNTWILIKHPRHFLIYNKASKYCIFDGTYVVLGMTEDKAKEENPIVAVITEIRINQDKTQCPVPIPNDFGLFMDLIL